MIAVYATDHGWTIRQDETELGYYSSLPDVMDVAYNKEREANSDGEAKGGNTDGHDR